jgi:phosphatidate cytidylyltransferase
MKTRILTAIILIAICLPPLFVGEWLFAIFIALAITLASIEVCSTGHGNNNWPKRIKVITILATLLMVFYNVTRNYMLGQGFSLASESLIVPPLGIAVTLLSYFILVILKSSINVEDVSYLFTMTMFLTLAGQSALYTRGLGIHSLIYVAVITFLTDTGGYFVGMLIGRNKINPRISPKKTYEGAIGATIVGTLAGIVYALVFKAQLLSEIKIAEYWLYIIPFALSIMGQVGDFTFSAIKRHYGVKDFSHLLPGHGGVLDRVDSIIVNLIVFSIFVVNITRGFNWWVA